VLFAINEEYCLNEKRAVGMIDSFNIPVVTDIRLVDLHTPEFEANGND
jgi:hypothetical protein